MACMSYVKRLGIVLLVLLLCVCCDQATKYTAKGLLHPYLPVSLFNDAVRLQYAENKGAFLSLGSSLPEETRFWVFTVAVSLALLGLFACVVVRLRKMKFSNVLALTLIVAGSISNVIDRMLNNGRVVDFLNIGIGSLRTGIFNIADVAITVGVCLVVLNSFLKVKFSFRQLFSKLHLE